MEFGARSLRNRDRFRPEGRAPKAARYARWIAIALVSTVFETGPAVGAPGSPHFEENRGQTNPEVRFLARGRNATLFLTADAAIFEVRGSATQSGAVRMALRDARNETRVRAGDALPGRSHYFIGNDPDAWRTGVPHYGRVHYEEPLPGVDLVFHGERGRLEFDFVLAPGARADAIALDFQGADAIALDDEGALCVAAGGGTLRLAPPIAWQEGPREAVEARFAVRDDGGVGFSVGSYDPSRALVIDPVIEFGTYLGDTGSDEALGVAVDAAGNVYVTGVTASANFPTATGSFDENCGVSACNQPDAFVSKLSADGSTLLYSTFLGGDLIENDLGGDITVDASGAATVVGTTTSTNFPTTPMAYDLTCGTDGNCNIVQRDVFVTQLTPAGDGLVFSTYLGGENDDWGNGIALDGSGNVIVTGGAESTQFDATPGAFAGFNLPGDKSFVSKFDPTGAQLLFSTSLLVASSNEEGRAVAADPLGNVYVAGQTLAETFPSTDGAFIETRPGNVDAYVAKFKPDGSALVYATFVGDAGDDEIRDIAVDPNGVAHVVGGTSSENFPTTAGSAQETFAGVSDAFVLKLDGAGSGPVFSTFLGGSQGFDRATSVALDARGGVYLAGESQAVDFPVTPDALTVPSPTMTHAFFSQLSADGATLVSSTRLGGLGSDGAEGVAVDAAGDAYVVGSTTASNFPTTDGAFQESAGGGLDGFIVKLNVPEATSSVGGSVALAGLLTLRIVRAQCLRRVRTRSPRRRG